jgi:hypothetical protein
MNDLRVQLLVAVAWVSAIAYGASGASLPRWLQQTGWALFAIYLVCGSLYLLLKPKHAGQRWGQAGIFPRNWQRWFLDGAEVNVKK